jgi:hypothetical protein
MNEQPYYTIVTDPSGTVTFNYWQTMSDSVCDELISRHGSLNKAAEHDLRFDLHDDESVIVIDHVEAKALAVEIQLKLKSYESCHVPDA